MATSGETKPALTKPKILLVEGQDEVFFFKEFFTLMGQSEAVEIIPLHGKKNLLPKLKAIILDTNFSILTTCGILEDADQDERATFDSVKTAIEDGNKLILQQSITSKTFSIPDRVGEIAQDNGIKLGILILPGDKEQGMLETLCLNAAQYPKVTSHIETYLTALKELASQSITSSLQPNCSPYHSPKNLHKARSACYLAGMEEYDSRLGIALKKKYFNFESPSFQPIKAFFTQLFG